MKVTKTHISAVSVKSQPFFHEDKFCKFLLDVTLSNRNRGLLIIVYVKTYDSQSGTNQSVNPETNRFCQAQSQSNSVSGDDLRKKLLLMTTIIIIVIYHYSKFFCNVINCLFCRRITNLICIRVFYPMPEEEE